MFFMDTKLKNYLGISVIAALGLALVAGFWYVSVYSRSVIPQRTFSVSGEGKAIAVPDVTELSFGVITEGGRNLADLQKENAERIDGIIALLKARGIEEKDIKTQFYNITPRYQYFSCPSGERGAAVPCPPPEIVGYTINQSVSVKIRDLNKAGDLLSDVVAKGANVVSGLNFTVDDPTEFQNRARAEAIAKAKGKAEAVAKAGGFRLGKLISISEGVQLPQPILFERFAVGKGGDFGGAPAVEPGSQEIRVSVTLSYEIR